MVGKQIPTCMYDRRQPDYTNPHPQLLIVAFFELRGFAVLYLESIGEIDARRARLVAERTH